MKPIKFNLSYGNERIKTLAELKESCNIDMLLETLENGLLIRWLTAQGETELSEKVAKIDKSNYRKATSELLKLLFDKEASCIEQATAALFAVREKEAKRLESLKNIVTAEKEIIAQYHTGYENVLKLLKENSEDYALLKAQMIVLYTQYSKLLELDKTRFYEIFKTGYPLVFLAFMANVQLREFIGYESEIVYKDVTKNMDTGIVMDNIDLESIKNRIKEGKKHPAILIENNNQLNEFKKKYEGKKLGCIYQTVSSYAAKEFDASMFIVGNYYVPLSAITLSHVKTFSGKTDSYWKDIEPRGKKFMIIKMEEGNKLRNAGVTGEEMTAKDINGKFIFTNGIDYMSNSDSDKLIYMEV